jgi:hypothetical protein
MRGPCLVMLDEAFKNLLRCQALMPEDDNGHVAFERLGGRGHNKLDIHVHPNPIVMMAINGPAMRSRTVRAMTRLSLSGMGFLSFW